MSDKIDQPPTAEKSAKPEVKFVMPRKWAKRQAPHPLERHFIHGLCPSPAIVFHVDYHA